MQESKFEVEAILINDYKTNLNTKIKNERKSKEVENVKGKEFNFFFKNLKRAMKFGSLHFNGVKNVSERFTIVGDCIPIHQASSKSCRAPPIPKRTHLPVESIDGVVLGQELVGQDVVQRKMHELEEQTKLIPLLQLQIQALRDERHQLLIQLESRPSSTSSSSPHAQPVFQAHRVSPVSLNAMKIAPVVMPKRTAGTNTGTVLSRDVGCSPITPTKSVHRGTSTDFVLKCEGDGGRLYTEKDLKKAIEMAHAKMRKTSFTIGTQFSEPETEKYLFTNCVLFVK